MKEDNSWIWVLLVGALLAAMSVIVILLGCGPSDYTNDPQFAKGGKPTYEFEVDSVTVLPADTTVFTGDTVQFHAIVWATKIKVTPNGKRQILSHGPYLHCPEYSLSIPYTGDREACARYVPSDVRLSDNERAGQSQRLDQKVRDLNLDKVASFVTH